METYWFYLFFRIKIFTFTTHKNINDEDIHFVF